MHSLYIYTHTHKTMMTFWIKIWSPCTSSPMKWLRWRFPRIPRHPPLFEWTRSREQGACATSFRVDLQPENKQKEEISFKSNQHHHHHRLVILIHLVLTSSPRWGLGTPVTSYSLVEPTMAEAWTLVERSGSTRQSCRAPSPTTPPLWPDEGKPDSLSIASSMVFLRSSILNATLAGVSIPTLVVPLGVIDLREGTNTYQCIGLNKME